MNGIELKNKLEAVELASKEKLLELKLKIDADIEMINLSYDKFIQSIPRDTRPAQEDNAWFERRELPPVGVECEVVLTPCANYGIKCIILDDKNIAYKVGKEWKTTAILYGTTFRPIRTEREKAIEAAAKIAEEHNKSGAKEFYGALYDAGLLRLPEGK